MNDQLAPTTAWQFDAAHQELRVTIPLTDKAIVTVKNLRLLTQLATQLDPETLTLTVPDSRTFSGGTTLHYVRYTAAAATPLRIRNARGQVLRELPTEAATGPHDLKWDGRDAQGRPVAPGLYDAELHGQHQRLVKLPY